jgi:eukaryotic-like serine/threonine-protein kinase
MPRMLGRYALYERIASGGMATVHLGRLHGPVGFARTVAIKRMHPQLAQDPEFVSMFLDEARLAARIRHPNVVPTLDVVATAGELFLVMDFVQGESLSRLIRGATDRAERIPPEMVAAMMVGALHGLHAAHEAKSDRGEPLGVVHRDVSPHNILVGTDGVARVLDFGVAKATGRIQTTRDGQLKGKLAYMAPEQIEGTVSRTTDVYAAAVVLWEALTGRRLFQGENDGQLMRLVLKGCTVPPSRYASNVSPALDAVTMRGLQVEPTERFSTAREMARALEEAIPLATASRIGDWVEMAAKETLDERSARIASIESDSSVHPDIPPPPPPPRRPSTPVVDTMPTSATDDAATQISSGALSSPDDVLEIEPDPTRSASIPSGDRHDPLRSPPRRTAWLAMIAGGGLLFVAAVMVTRPSSRAISVAASPAQAPSAAAPSPSLPTSPEPAAAAIELDDASPSILWSDLPVAPAEATRRRSPVRHPTPAPSSSKPAYNPLEHL